MKITLIAAAGGEVTGSCYSVQTKQARIFLHAMNSIPMTPGVPYNTIIGDRGRRDSPNSSDGVVPYWSSHMKGAESEHIVPSDHSAHQNPKAIAEVLRILKAHAH